VWKRRAPLERGAWHETTGRPRPVGKLAVALADVAAFVAHVVHPRAGFALRDRGPEMAAEQEVEPALFELAIGIDRQAAELHHPGAVFQLLPDVRSQRGEGGEREAFPVTSVQGRPRSVAFLTAASSSSSCAVVKSRSQRPEGN